MKVDESLHGLVTSHPRSHGRTVVMYQLSDWERDQTTRLLGALSRKCTTASLSVACNTRIGDFVFQKHVSFMTFDPKSQWKTIRPSRPVQVNIESIFIGVRRDLCVHTLLRITIFLLRSFDQHAALPTSMDNRIMLSSKFSTGFVFYLHGTCPLVCRNQYFITLVLVTQEALY